MENKTTINGEYRLTWKDFGYYNVISTALLAILVISLLIWLIRGVE